jgi:hypothetical protein
MNFVEGKGLYKNLTHSQQEFKAKVKHPGGPMPVLFAAPGWSFVFEADHAY